MNLTIEKSNQNKRLFFGLKIEAPWPASLPQGRVIEEPFRHITIAFLGENNAEHILEKIDTFPPFPFLTGIVGQFNKIVFLPPRMPRVVAWHIDFYDKTQILVTFHEAIIAWAKERKFRVDEKKRPFLPHMTICRKPFVVKEWEKSFIPLPLMISELHLYESLGYSRYESLWSKPFISPFEDMPHTADIAYKIRGENLYDLFYHGLTAIAFKYPEISPFFHKPEKIDRFEDVVIEQNQIIAQVDQNIGSPIKAISFHGEAKKIEKNLLEWEMIIDV